MSWKARWQAIDAKGDAFIERMWARYKRFRLDQAAKSKAYLTYCGKTMTPMQSFVKTSIGVVFELLTIVLGLIFLWLNAIFFFVKAERVDLSIFKPNAALWFSDTFAGQSADLSSLRVERKRGSNRLSVIAQDIRVNDVDGAEILAVPYIQTDFDLKALAFGNVVMKKAVIEGGAVTVLRKEDGSVTAGLGRPETIGRFGPVMGDSPEVGDEQGTQEATIKQSRVVRWRDIEIVQVKSGEASIIDQRDGLNLTLTGLDLDYVLDDEMITARASSSIVSENALTPFEFNFQGLSDFSSLEIDMKLVEFLPAELTPKRGRFSHLSRLDAPVTLAGKIKASGALIDDIELSVDIGSGAYNNGVKTTAFDEARLRTEYDVETQSLALSNMYLASDRLRFSGGGTLSNIGNLETGFGKSDMGVKLNLEDVFLSSGSVFEDDFQPKTVRYTGKVNLSNRHYSFTELDIDFDGYGMNLAGELILNDNDVPIELLKVDGTASGNITPSTVLKFWPTHRGVGARTFIKERVLSAQFKDVRLETHITPERIIPDDRTLSGYVLHNDALRATFRVEEADVQVVPTLGTLKQASGRAVVLGNKFDLSIDQSRISDTVIASNGSVRIPIMAPKGNLLFADFDVVGPVPEILTYLSAPPISLAQKSNIVPSAFSGDAQARVSIQLPLLDALPQGALKFSATGQVLNASAPYGIGRYKAHDAILDLHVDNDGLQLSGPVFIGPWQAHAELNDRFDEGLTPLALNLTGKVTLDQLNRFGFGVRRFFGGEMDLTITSLGEGVSLKTFNVLADLTRSNLFFDGVWSKPEGSAGQLTGAVTLLDGGGYDLTGIGFSAQGLDIVGDIRLEQDFKLQSLFLPKFNIDKLITGGVAIKRQSDDDLIMALNGSYLNLSPWTKQALSPQTSGITLPLNVSAEIDQLVLRDNFSLTDAKFDYENDGTGINEGRLIGQYESEPFSAQISSLEGEQGRSIAISIPNAGVAMRNFYGLKNIQGGQLSINGTLPPPGQAGGVVGLAVVSNFKLVEAPVFARLLSLASLQGLGEILSGDGMNFSRFEAPFEFENGVLSFKDANASGSAVGMTGTGYIDFRGQMADIEGVLVPAYAVNSLLGGVPVIGDIVVGRKGEGIFALSYTVKGPFAKTQISVNPLSALTPGFLRQIFQPRSQEPL